MTKFEEIGVNRQLESDSSREALRSFRHSCEVCCYKNIRIDCDKCSIAHVHREVLAYFSDRQLKVH